MPRTLPVAALVIVLLVAWAATRAEEGPAPDDGRLSLPACDECQEVWVEGRIASCAGPTCTPTPTPTPNCPRDGEIRFTDPGAGGAANLTWRTSGIFSRCRGNWQLTEGRWIEFSFCGRMALEVGFFSDDDACVNWPGDYAIGVTVNDAEEDRWALRGIGKVRILEGDPLLTDGENRVRLTVLDEDSKTEGCYLDYARTY